VSTFLLYIQFTANYDGDIIFAFDDYKDAPIIEEKLNLIRQLTNKNVKFYVLCGYDRRDKFDDKFFRQDLKETALRLRLLKKYNCKGYVMRFEKCYSSTYQKIYSNLSSWVNQPQFFAKMPFTDFVSARYKNIDMTIVNELQNLME